MSPEANAVSKMYIHRRIVVRFLLVLLTVLSALSFASIAFGWGRGTDLTSEDSGTPTQLTDLSPFYVLLIGSDSLEGTALYSGDVGEVSQGVEDEEHADSLALVRVDPATFTITLITVPANTVLYDSDIEARYSLMEGGPIQAVYTVERITGVDVRYYFMLDFSGFEELVRQVGRVRADVPVPIRMQDPVSAKTVTVKSGENMRLDAPSALAYVRAWDIYAKDVDEHRQLNVRNVITDIIGQVLEFDDEKVRKVLGSFEKNCETDIDNELLISLVTRFYENKEAVTVYACTGPYYATSLGSGGRPIIRQPVSAWRELMTVVDAGENPAAAFPEYDFKGDASDYIKPRGEQEASSSSSKGSRGSKSSASAKSKDKKAAEQPAEGDAVDKTEASEAVDSAEQGEAATEQEPAPEGEAPPEAQGEPQPETQGEAAPEAPAGEEG